VWLAALLAAVGDTVLTLKWLLKRRTWRGAWQHWAHTATTWALLRKTAWGLRPTR